MEPRLGPQRRRLITGVGGALGRALVRNIREDGPGTPIYGVDRHAVAIEGVLAERLDLVTAQFETIVRPGDVVFHLAAFVHRPVSGPQDQHEVYELNHRATARLAAACLEKGASLVFSSTVAVEASTDYGRSKALAEEAIRALGEKGLDFAIVRFPLLYGPYGAGNMERLLRAIASRRYWPIGNPRIPKSCLFIDDAARALILAIEHACSGTWVVAPPTPPTLGEIHSAAYRALGKRPPRRAIPRSAALLVSGALQATLRMVGRSTRLPEQIRTLTSEAAFDGSAFAARTGFRPRVDVRDGMTRTVAWLMAQRNEDQVHIR